MLMYHNIVSDKAFRAIHAWVQRKLGEGAEFSYGGGTPSTVNDEFWNGDIPWLQSSDLTEHNVTQVNLRKYITQKGLKCSAAKLVPAKSIAIVTRVGVGKLCIVPFQYTTSQDFLSLSKLNVDIWFGVYVIYKKLQGELYSVQGTSIKGITKEELLNKTINVPSSIPEQTSIGNFIRALDDTITLYKRKLDGLKELKRGYLQQMFPQSGEDIPLLRFVGFAEPWEQLILNDIVVKLTGGASIEPNDYQDFGVRTIPKGAINATGVADLSGSKFISNFFYEKNKSSMVSTTDIVTSLRDLVPSAPSMGRIVRIEGAKEDFLMPQGVYKIELLDGISENFVISYSNSEKYRKIIFAEKNGSTQVHIRNGEFLNIDIPVPSSDEQSTIGNFFRNLDDQIAAYQSKLDKLKQLKSTYLQKMFI